MADLPRGAVTFLFTDVEGSTRLLKELRERYGEVLAEHQRLLEAAFDRHGGRVVDTQGDSFFVVFGNARDAVLAAIEAQRALGEHNWPEGADLRVRMGIHSGQAAASEEKYLGLAVHRAARISASGHGGQILVSQTTQNLLEDEEETSGVELRASASSSSRISTGRCTSTRSRPRGWSGSFRRSGPMLRAPPPSPSTVTRGGGRSWPGRSPG